jgi:ribosomal protein S18 acetylase RimI-like enzyme
MMWEEDYLGVVVVVIRPVTMDDYWYLIDYADSWWGRTGELGLFLRKKDVFGSQQINLVAEKDKELVGFLFGRLIEKGELDKEGFISFVCVNPRWRNRGIAKSLYEQFALEAREEGAQRLTAVTYKGNLASLKFHQKMGFVLQFENKNLARLGYERVNMVRSK